jgi:hypothetical protein
MSKPFIILALIAVLAAVACNTQARMLDTLQANAMATAASHGQSEMSCPTASNKRIWRHDISLTRSQFKKPNRGTL